MRVTNSLVIDLGASARFATGNIARRRMRVAGRMLGSLLLGGVAILGSILIFRQGLLPLIEAVFHPGPELLSFFRRAGIVLAADVLAMMLVAGSHAC